jgi:hypothetical protein
LEKLEGCPTTADEKTAKILLLLFPSAVLTASGSKGISQHKAPLKFFVNVYNKLWKKRIFKKNAFAAIGSDRITPIPIGWF